jgi:predicted MFS family arabinose efflux permease
MMFPTAPPFVNDCGALQTNLSIKGQYTAMRGWADNYRQVFAYHSFRNFWVGFSLSYLGDTISRVALTWFVYETTHAPEALGLLSLFYTGPVIVGGLMAGWLLDRFDRRRVMMVDSLLRAAIFMLIPLLHAAGILALWHVYAVAAVYGFLMMIPLAGGPTIVPTLVPREQLPAANALEMLSFTLGGVIGPPLAGLLIARTGAPNVVILDALSYLIFALSLTRVHPLAAETVPGQPRQSYCLGHAFRLLRDNKILLATTFMFMAANIGGGALFVWLPIFSDRLLGGGAEFYGTLLGFMAAGEVASSLLAGSLALPFSFGTAICLTQIFAGASVGIFLIAPSRLLAIASVSLYGLFSAPMTIWAQTLRMRIIPPALRGRTFALLRMLMQSGNPVGGAAAGLALPLLGLPVTVALSALFISVPAMLGSRVRALRSDGRSEQVSGETVAVE